MKTSWTLPSLILALLMCLPTASAIAAERDLAMGEMNNVKGWMIDYNYADRSVLIEIADGGEKSYWRYRVSDNAQWHICLQDQCMQTKGADGFDKLGMYAQYESYGMPHRSYKVTFDKAGQVISRIEVEIVAGKHN